MERCFERLALLASIHLEGGKPLRRALDLAQGANEILLGADVGDLALDGTSTGAVERCSELGHPGSDGTACFGGVLDTPLEAIDLLGQLPDLALLLHHRRCDIVTRAAADEPTGAYDRPVQGHCGRAGYPARDLQRILRRAAQDGVADQALH